MPLVTYDGYQYQEVDWEPDESVDSVELIASGYEWTCPTCGTLNRLTGIADKVICDECRGEWPVSETYDAYE